MVGRERAALASMFGPFVGSSTKLGNLRVSDSKSTFYFKLKVCPAPARAANAPAVSLVRPLGFLGAIFHTQPSGGAHSRGLGLCEKGDGVGEAGGGVRVSWALSALDQLPQE